MSLTPPSPLRAVVQRLTLFLSLFAAGLPSPADVHSPERG